MTIDVRQICRFPVKGMNAESLERVALSVGETLPHDRRFAIAHGSTNFNSKAPQWQAKTNFLMLAKDEKLAQLRMEFDDDTGFLTIFRGGKQVVRANATDIMGRTLIGQFFAGFMAGASRGTPKLLEAPGHSFTDAHEKYVSLINLASIRDLERVARAEIDPARFRANFYIEGLPAWQEMRWAGKEITLGKAQLRIVKRIDRCAAINVNPATAERDMNLPLTLRKGFSHIDMGIYVMVTAAGEVALGDALTPPS